MYIRFVLTILLVLGICASSFGERNVKEKEKGIRKARASTRDSKKERMVIYVLEKDAAYFNQKAVEIFGPHAANTFSVPFESGSKKKYYVASFSTSDEKAQLLQAALNKKSNAKLIKVKPDQVKSKLEELTLKPVKSDSETRSSK